MTSHVRVTLLFLLTNTVSHVTAEGDLFECDAANDSCPSPFNGQCNRDTNPSCASGDCFDCDPCQAFHFDCAACTTNGCYWCPSDGECFHSSFYSRLVGSTCAEEDFTTDSVCTADDHFFSDPLYSAQKWVYDMINILPVWEKGLFGKDIRVRVNDNAFNPNLNEFGGRFDSTAGCNALLPPDNVLSGLSDPYHGSVAASIIGAEGNNGQCAVGIAPEVTLSGCLTIGTEDFLDLKLNEMDISNNSWGRSGCDKTLTGRRRKLTECPFSFTDTRFTFPCDVCGDFSVITPTCESAIQRHCNFYYENDVDGCIDF